jgi:hypothetical protein
VTVKIIHEYLEKNCKKGAGFALRAQTVSDTVGELLQSLAVSTRKNTDLALDQSSDVRFSFLLDAASFVLSPDLELSIKLKVWLHPKGDSANPIVTLEFIIGDAQLEPLYDAAISEFCWISKSSTTVSITSEVWGTDGALIAAGYKKPDNTADKQRFLEEIFYGFKWVSLRNLLPSIIRNIPFPQIQKWFLPFVLRAPFKSHVSDGYLMVWTDDVLNIFQDCGQSQTPSAPPKGTISQSGSPASPYDQFRPSIATYIAATNLLSWQASQLAPAVMLSKNGGGFVRWSYDLAVSVTSLVLDLLAAPNGGGLHLGLTIRIAGIASAWIDGPSGTRLSVATATLTADGSVDASAMVQYTPQTGHIDLETTVSANIDKSSIDLAGGGLFGQIEAEVIELLIKTGIFKIDTSYYSRTRMPLIDLNDVVPPSRSVALQRIGGISMLTFYTDSPGRD